jgi:hypothetical protein
MYITTEMKAVRSLFFAQVLVNIKTTWHFQPQSPRQVLYILSQVTTFLQMEIHRNTLGNFSVAIFAFTVP